MLPELIVFFAAMTPFLDLKLSIPLGIEMGVSTTSTFLFSIAGSIIPAALALYLIGPISRYARNNSKKLDNFFIKLFAKTRDDHGHRFQRFGPIFLLAFVVLPLPGSGSIGGAIVAFLFGVEYWKALSFISLGVIITGLFLTAGLQSIFAIFPFLNFT